MERSGARSPTHNGKMTTMKTILFVLTNLIVCFTLVGCLTPDQQLQAQDLAETITAATKDGVVTPEEKALIKAKTDTYTGSFGGTDWRTLLGTAAGTVLTSLIGVRILPNALVVGKQEAAALNKAAGIT